MARYVAVFNEETGCVEPLPLGQPGQVLTINSFGEVVWSSSTGGTISGITVTNGIMTITFANGTTQTFPIVQFCS